MARYEERTAGATSSDGASGRHDEEDWRTAHVLCARTRCRYDGRLLAAWCGPGHARRTRLARQRSSWVLCRQAATDVGGDCRTDNKGSFRIDGTEAHFSWLEAAERCMVRCLNCERCNHMTVAIIREGLWSVDCSWYYACARPLHAPNGRNMHGLSLIHI